MDKQEMMEYLKVLGEVDPETKAVLTYYGKRFVSKYILRELQEGEYVLALRHIQTSRSNTAFVLLVGGNVRSWKEFLIITDKRVIAFRKFVYWKPAYTSCQLSDIIQIRTDTVDNGLVAAVKGELVEIHTTNHEVLKIRGIKKGSGTEIKNKILEASGNKPGEDCEIEESKEQEMPQNMPVLPENDASNKKKAAKHKSHKAALRVLGIAAGIIILLVVLACLFGQPDITELSEAELKNACKNVTYDTVFQNIDEYTQEQTPIKIDCIIMSNEEGGFLAIDYEELDNPQARRSYFILTEEIIPELEEVLVYGYVEGLNKLDMPLIKALYIESYEPLVEEYTMPEKESQPETVKETQTEPVLPEETVADEQGNMPAGSLSNAGTIPIVTDIFGSSGEQWSWNSDVSGYYLIPFCEDEAYYIWFSSANDTTLLNTAYTVEVDEMEETSSGGVICRGDMYQAAKDEPVYNGRVEITWSSMESIDYCAVKMIDGNQFTDVSMVADDYCYYGMTDDNIGGELYLGNVKADELYEKDGWEGELIFPDSSVDIISDEVLVAATDEELFIGKNEIYASYGCIFSSEELQNHFSECSWYIPSVNREDFDENVLSEIERENVRRIQAEIDKRN